MKTLRETIKAGMPFGAEGLTMDTFGAIMDKFIDESNVALLIHKEAGGDWQIRGVGCGAVVDFYIYTAGIVPLFLQAMKEFGRIAGGIDAVGVAHALAGELEKAMVEAAKEAEEEGDA